MSNWRVPSESQNEELHPELDSEISVSQPTIRTLLLPSPAPLHKRPQEEAGPSRPSKQPRMEQWWYGNLPRDARALVILLQVGSVEPDTRGVTFGGIFQGLNDDQYFCCLKPIRGSRGHQRGLKVQFIHCLRLIVRTTLQLFFGAFSSSCR